MPNIVISAHTASILRERVSANNWHETGKVLSNGNVLIPLEESTFQALHDALEPGENWDLCILRLAGVKSN